MFFFSVASSTDYRCLDVVANNSKHIKSGSSCFLNKYSCKLSQFSDKFLMKKNISTYSFDL